MQHRPRGQARSSSSSFAAPGRVLSNTTWGRLELPCKRCRWRTKRRADGCPDRGMHDPGHEVVPSGRRRLSPWQEPVKGLSLCSAIRLAAGQLAGRNANQQGAKTVGGTALISAWTLRAATPDLTRGSLGLRLLLWFGARGRRERRCKQASCSGQLAADERQWERQTRPYLTSDLQARRGGKGKRRLRDVGSGQGGVLVKMS